MVINFITYYKKITETVIVYLYNYIYTGVPREIAKIIIYKKFTFCLFFKSEKISRNKFYIS